MANFEGKERRIEKINSCLEKYGFSSLEEARDLCLSKGINVEEIVKGIQTIAFDNAVWAYTLGTAIAISKGTKIASEAAQIIGIGLQAFCIPGSVAEQRDVGMGHGNLASMLLKEETKCFCFLAGHESFAAAEGAIGIARTANKARKEPLRVILNGLGKDAAYIISRINGFTYVETEYNFETGELKVIREKAFSSGDKAAVRVFGANDVLEGVEIMKFEKVDVSITGNSTNTAIAISKGTKIASEAAQIIGIGLQAFCIPGSVAEQRDVGMGHGNLASMLLKEETKCFCFLAGHESFAAAEGAIGIARTANKARKEPLRVILNGLGKDAAYIISRINGFTYVETEYNFETGELKVIREKAFSSGDKSAVRVFGANDVLEGVEIMKFEKVDVSITGNSTNPTRFQHLVAGTYKKWSYENGVKYFSVASGGGTGRTLHPDNVGAGPASYGLTDSMGRMHGDAQFAGSSSVPAHVEMMGLIGMGNNPMVGATVACSVAVEQAMK